MKTPLPFQEGEGWEYGLQKHVFQPRGIKEMSMIPSHEVRKKLTFMNNRGPDGTLGPRDHSLRAPLIVDLDNEADVGRIFNSGGAGIFAKPQEYCSEYPENFIKRHPLTLVSEILAVLLNDGTCPKTGSQLLRGETVKEMFTNQIPQFPSYSRQGIPAAKPDLTNPIPEMYAVSGDPPQGWGLMFMLGNGGATGRSTGTAHWAGLPNLWWWAGREKGVAGMVCTQILPFKDVNVLGLWVAVESEVYKALGDGSRITT
ncbi:beta-lactamase/transpeptidase-like protein [Penicillium argentinense]|uniref:Beta-lactamase/transpeptidase-like protein n=1 Tax=Penicillium argentinense TaxID=1131581 RepID=A0A9W9FFT8_9EURO|nr:beta-lactamase/transpeptidase-like protein [Penicillium argentinense]KAJ5099440.1 beta-lactamase/transpeptidase-like protein [Penicillium argentinense]